MYALTHPGVHGSDGAPAPLSSQALQRGVDLANAHVPKEAAAMPRCLFCRYRRPSEGKEDTRA